MDSYTSFENLKSCERRGIDYRIGWRMGSSGIAILSIHGGDIEPGTTCIANGIAGPDHAFYAFEGIKIAGNLDLHITSNRFDEPTAMEIVCLSEIIISVHGCAEMEQVVHLGGLDVELRQRILQKLRESGFQATECSGLPFGGADQKNICNLCGRGMGVQMEISRGLRVQMFRDLSPEGRRFTTEVFSRFTGAVREAIAPFAGISTESDTPNGTD
jgi:phage replication-related protein YjqB (UPF0714/DUF867 family)